jgi:hypothetical protein
MEGEASLVEWERLCLLSRRVERRSAPQCRNTPYIKVKTYHLTKEKIKYIIFSPKATTRDTGFDRVFQRAVHFGESIVLQSPILPPFSFPKVTIRDVFLR